MMIRTKPLIAACAVLLSNLQGLQSAETADETRARFIKDAEKGDAEAQYRVGSTYMPWEGGPQNFTEAAKWLRKASDQGHAAAQFWLGDFYRWGRGVPKDPVEGARYYRMAAEQGYLNGLWSLSHCYRDGTGVPHDPVEAYKWMNLALAQAPGDETDIGSSKWMLKSQITSLAKEMSAQQIALAQRLSTEFVPRQKQPKVTNERDGDLLGSPKSTGSGFLISDDGSLITNFHVVEKASRVVVRTKQGSFSTKIVKLDPVNDIALLKVAGSGFRSLPLISRAFCLQL